MFSEIKLKISGTLTLIEKYIWQFLLICIPIILIYVIMSPIVYKFNLWNMISVSKYIPLVLNFIYNGFYLTILIFLINIMYENKKFSINDVFLFIRQKFLGIALIIFVIKILTNIGFILLILPGIYILSRLAITPYLFSIDGCKIYNSFWLSLTYSKKYVWTIFLTIIIINIPIIPVFIIRVLVSNLVIVSIISFLLQLYYIVEVVLFYIFYLEIKEFMLKDLQNNG